MLYKLLSFSNVYIYKYVTTIIIVYTEYY